LPAAAPSEPQRRPGGATCHHARHDDPPPLGDRLLPAPEIDLALGACVRNRTHDAATLDEAHCHCLRRPSSSETRGSQPSSERILVVSAFVRRWSPGTGSVRWTSSVRPAISSRIAIASFIDASIAPPTLYVPLPRSIARLVASTTSAPSGQRRDR